MKLLTTNDICKIYGVTKQAVSLWRDKGMPFHYYGPRTLLHDLEEVEKFVEENTTCKRKVVEYNQTR